MQKVNRCYAKSICAQCQAHLVRSFNDKGQYNLALRMATSLHETAKSIVGMIENMVRGE